MRISDPVRQKILGCIAVLIFCLSLSSVRWAKGISLAAGVQSGPQGAPKSDEEITKPGRALLQQIRHISSESYSRVIMDLSAEVQYETRVLKEDISKSLPPRIYVDLRGARLAMDASQPIVVHDRLLRQVRVGQFSPDVVRVVLDMKSLREHRAFLLPEPYRLIIDIQGDGEGSEPLLREKGKVAPPPAAKKVPPVGIRKIVLDPGHGGKDTGAIGIGGLTEKEIVLSLAKKLARKLTKEMGVEVVLTRKDDSFIHLPDRTAIANAENADLFISLHTNASPHRHARGIETYYLDNTDDEASLRLAARENGISRKNVSDIQFILSDLIQNYKLEDSIGLAHHLQSSLVSHMEQRYGGMKDLGVKKAGFYVLVGAKMPSVLVEILFITHSIEGRQLGKSAYQDAIVDALYQGIKKYRDSSLVVKSL